MNPYSPTPIDFDKTQQELTQKLIDEIYKPKFNGLLNALKKGLITQVEFSLKQAELINMCGLDLANIWLNDI